jgi:hypothetical protein
MLHSLSTSSHEPEISLTLARPVEGCSSGTVRVPAFQLLAYDQERGFTRLTLTGRTSLDVRESTDEIDRLVRAAASRGQPARA